VSYSRNHFNTTDDTQSKPFDYVSLDLRTRKFVLQRTESIRAIFTQTIENAFLVGEMLLEVKEKLGHGEFCKWIDCEFQWSQSTAMNQMHLASRFKFATVANLNLPLTILYELSRPTTPESAMEEVIKLATQGHERLTKAQAKCIIRQHKRCKSSAAPSSITIDVPYRVVHETSGKVVQFSRNRKHKAIEGKHQQQFNSLDLVIQLLDVHIKQIEDLVGELHPLQKVK
jgi:hypothetical protein